MHRYATTPGGLAASPTGVDLAALHSRLEALEQRNNAATPSFATQMARGGRAQQPTVPAYVAAPTFATNPSSWTQQQQQERFDFGNLDTAAPLSATRKRTGGAAAPAASSSTAYAGKKQHQQQQQHQDKSSYQQQQQQQLSNTQFSSQASSTSSSLRTTSHANNGSGVLVANLQSENAALKEEVAALKQQLSEAAVREASLRQALLDLATAGKRRAVNATTADGSASSSVAVKTEFVDDDDDNNHSGVSTTRTAPLRRGRNQRDDAAAADDAMRSASLRANAKKPAQHQQQHLSRASSSSSSTASSTVQYSRAAHEGYSTILSPPPKMVAAAAGGHQQQPRPLPQGNQQNIPPQMGAKPTLTRNGPASADEHSSPAYWSRNHEHVTERELDVVASAVVGAQFQSVVHQISQRQHQHASRSLGGPLSAPPVHGGGLSRGQSPLPEHPLRAVQSAERHFTFSGFAAADKDALARLILQLGQRADVVECETDEPPPKHVTHVVVPDQPLSVKALCALVSGRWIVTPEYLYKSQQLGFWAREESVAKAQRCPDFPLRGRTVLLQVPAEHRALREALRSVVEYGEGIVAPENYSTRSNYHRGDLILVSSGNDIRSLCQQ